MTGLPTSQVYRTVLGLWRGDRDYLTYLKTIVGFVPHGGAVARTIVEAIEYTEKARQIGGTVRGDAARRRRAADSTRSPRRRRRSSLRRRPRKPKASC